MRRVLDDKKLPNVTVKAGKADSIPLDDGSVDAVICAQVGMRFYYLSGRSFPYYRNISRSLPTRGAS